jgi:hypothetical protein
MGLLFKLVEKWLTKSFRGLRLSEYSLKTFSLVKGFLNARTNKKGKICCVMCPPITLNKLDQVFVSR